MNKGRSVLILSLLVSLVLVSIPQIEMVKAEGTIYIRADGSVEGTDKIQRDGNVYTFAGDLFDSIIVEKDNVVIDGAGYTLGGTGSETGISLIDRTNVTIKNVQIQYFSVGIALNDSCYNAISGNNITHNDYQASIFVFNNSSNNKITKNNIEANNANGIWLKDSFSNIISENKIKANGFEGIIVSGGSNNSISGNLIEKNNGDGIYLSSDSSGTTVTENNITENNPNGILLLYSSGNMISKNYIENNYRGVFLDASPNNTIVRNNIKENSRAGIEAITTTSKHNRIYHNNLIDNAEQIISTDSIGIWDNGKEGNYWSDYNGTDVNGDGIGDIQYFINENNIDRYPLMTPINFFDAGTWEGTQFSVHIISNSTVSNLNFKPESTLIRFNVEGKTGTSGFCRVAIPQDLLHAEDGWTVLVDGTTTTPSVQEAQDNTYLYFTYPHSIKTVEIQGTEAIPAFSSWTFLVVVLITVTGVMMLYRRKV